MSTACGTLLALRDDVHLFGMAAAQSEDTVAMLQHWLKHYATLGILVNHTRLIIECAGASRTRMHRIARLLRADGYNFTVVNSSNLSDVAERVPMLMLGGATRPLDPTPRAFGGGV